MTKYEPALSPIFAALGDPTRRAVVARLARGPATVTELAAGHDMALPTFLAHLRKLEVAGLLSSRKEGRVRTCVLLPGALAPAENWIEEQKRIWESRLDRFDAYALNLSKDTRDET